MADSVHEDILTLSSTRLAAITLGTTPNNPQARIVEREVLDAGWASGIAVYPLLVLSGVGVRTDLGNPSNCKDDDAYPLIIRIVDRVQDWSTSQRNNHYKWMHLIIDAFRHVPLTLTYTGASCLDIRLLPSITIEPEPLAYQLISRPLQFEVITRIVR